MRTREASRKEVKMHFLLADAFKPFVESENIQWYPSKKDFLEGYRGLSRAYKAFSERQLDKMIEDKDPVRLERYNSLDWSIGTVALSDISPWPEMDGLDIRLTTGNVPKTVKRFKKEFSHPSGLRIPDGFWPKVQSILYHDQLIIPRFPIILFPGGLERRNHNNWVRTSGEVPKAQQKDWICKISKYDIDAGNSRAFAYALAYLEKVDAYFGKARDK